MIETIGFVAIVALFFSLVGFIIAAIDLMLDNDPYFWRKMETDAWSAYMTFSCFIAISFVVILFVIP